MRNSANESNIANLLLLLGGVVGGRPHPRPLCGVLWSASLQSRPHFIVWPFSSRLQRCIISGHSLCFREQSRAKRSLLSQNRAQKKNQSLIEARSTRLRYPSGWRPAARATGADMPPTTTRSANRDGCRRVDGQQGGRTSAQHWQHCQHKQHPQQHRHCSPSSWMNLALFRFIDAQRLPVTLKRSAC